MKIFTKNPSILGGASIVASVCVGAGMLALPIKGAGAWTMYSMLALCFTMMMLTFSGWLLLESYQHYPFNVSFSSVTGDLLGKKVNFINNLAVYFVGVILLYAYISVSGDILSSKLSPLVNFGENSARIFSFIFVIIFSFIVWLGTRAVDRISVILVVFMILSFLFSITPFLSSVESSNLFIKDMKDENLVFYALIMLPVALSSFGYHHSVSSLRSYYKDENKAKWAIFGGTFMALCFYVLWIIAIFGNISRDEFPSIISSGGELGALLKALGASIDSNSSKHLLSAFSMAAILSSFIGVGLGVFDYLADFFGFKDDKIGRAKTWMVTFLPPLIFSLAYPFGFVKAIGYAGAVATIWTCLIPAVLIAKSRQKWGKGAFSVPCAKFISIILFLFGVLVASIEIIGFFDILPKFA